MNITSVKLTDNVDKVKRSTQASIRAALEGIGLHLEGEATEELNIPFPHADGVNRPYEDTGTLKGSITHRVVPDENAVYIGTNVKYSVYIHEGTSRIRNPNRFLKNAIEHNLDQIQRYFEEHLDG